MPSEPNPPKVFISYSHDSQEHIARVLKLSDALCRWSIDCHIDQYELAPANWLSWMQRQIGEADFVLVICTQKYCDRFEGRETRPSGVGWEGGVITTELYERQQDKAAKFIPIVFSVEDHEHVPTLLRPTHRHLINIEKLDAKNPRADLSTENLYRHLAGMPRVVKPKLGPKIVLPPINVQEEFDEGEKEGEDSSLPQVVQPSETKIEAKAKAEWTAATPPEKPNTTPSNTAIPTSVTLEMKHARVADTVFTQMHSDKIEGVPVEFYRVAASGGQKGHSNFIEDLGSGVKLEMIAIPGGSFLMGSEDFDNTKPVHPVKLSPFHIGKFQVTQAQWQPVVGRIGKVKIYDLAKELKLESKRILGDARRLGVDVSVPSNTLDDTTAAKIREMYFPKRKEAQRPMVMENNPSLFKGDNLPVEHVSWEMAVKFCENLSKKTGKEYRLPTEAEWEYACRAGSTGRYCFGDNPKLLEKHAWYYKNAGDKTHPVGEKLANDWGLHDMHGNVWEWCQDWYDEDYYWERPEENPQGPSSGIHRVLRGGSFSHDKDQCCSASRGSYTPNTLYRYLGFRVVCVARTS